MTENIGSSSSKYNNIKELKKEINLKLFNKYGLFPDKFIIDSLKEELLAIETGEKAGEIIILYEFVNWLKNEKIAYWLRGNAGASFIFYLLGITRGNPLPAYSYCPKCKTLYWLDNCYSGFDVIDFIECEDDGKTLVTDGHKIPWQSLWGYGNEKIVFTIDLPIKSYDRVRKFFEDYQVDRLNQRDLLTAKEEGKSLRFSNIDCLFTIGRTSPTFYENKLDIDWAIKSFNSIIGFNDEDSPLNLPSPQVFSDILYSFGLNYSTGAWTEKTKYMVENLGISLADMIVFREDIYYYLLNHGFCYVEAWLGAESFRKPEGFFKITDEMKFAANKWKLSICQDIKFIFPKAHALEYVFFQMKNQR